MKCWQCKNWSMEYNRCGKLDDTIRNKKTLLFGGCFPWECAYINNRSQLNGMCPKLRCDKVDRDEGYDHPECPMCNAEKNTGRFCSCGVREKRIVEYPELFWVETNPFECSSSLFDRSVGCAQRTLAHEVAISNFWGRKHIVKILQRKGWDITYSGWPKNYRTPFTVLKLLQDFGADERNEIQSIPRVGDRIISSIEEFFNDIEIYWDDNRHKWIAGARWDDRNYFDTMIYGEKQQ